MEIEQNQPHIIQMMIQMREETLMSYGDKYRKHVLPYKNYILEQMEERQIDSEVEMAIMMIQEAEQREDNELIIRNIMCGCMEIIDPSEGM